MSENLRLEAVRHAVMVSKSGDEAVATAQKLHSFLTATDSPPAAGKAATPATAATAAKPAKTGAKAATPEDKAAAALKTQNAAAAAAQDAVAQAETVPAAQPPWICTTASASSWSDCR